MKKFSVALIILLAVFCVKADLIIPVQPEGDGMVGKDRYGFTSGWESVPFDSEADPQWAGHWYDYSFYDGQSRKVYMQVSLDGVTQVDAAYLNIYVSECSGSGGKLYHKADASIATGLASQEIAGDEFVQDITGASGWTSIDVTPYIQSDVSNGYDWAVFHFSDVGYSTLEFNSGDSACNQPFLQVVPEPMTLALLGLGSVLLRRVK
jgi:hypothetical protein